MAHGFGGFQPIVEGGYSGGIGIVGAGERYFSSVGQAAKTMLKPGGQATTFKGPPLETHFPGARIGRTSQGSTTSLNGATSLETNIQNLSLGERGVRGASDANYSTSHY